MGPLLCKTIPAFHALTGKDSTSKFETKVAAVKLWKQDFKMMNELRYYLYHQQTKTVCDLPPTSHATKEHIQRAFYYTYFTTHCLTASVLDPTLFGFYEDDTHLKPIEGHVLLPSDLALPCKCALCATTRCVCRQASIACCIYCKYAFTQCRNPNIVLNVPVQM